MLRLHLTVARKRVLRIIRKLLHPTPQLRRMNTKVFRRLRIRHAALLNQPDCSSLNSRVNCLLVMTHLLFHKTT
jgi:hypothetical protein